MDVNLFWKVFVEVFLPNFLCYSFVAVLSYLLQKKALETWTRFQIINNNDCFYMDKLTKISSEIISNYKTNDDSETFDTTNVEIKRNMLLIFGTFDELYSLKSQENISRSTFEYWDFTITNMLRENYYIQGWNFCKNMDYYTNDFIKFVDSKITK